MQCPINTVLQNTPERLACLLAGPTHYLIGEPCLTSQLQVFSAGLIVLSFISSPLSEKGAEMSLKTCQMIDKNGSEFEQK